LIPGMLVRRALKGDLALIAAAKALQDELLGPPSMPADEGTLADESRAVTAFKKTALMALGLAMQTFGQKLTDQQEVLMHIADILIDTFSAESAVLRARAAADRGLPKAELHLDAARVFVADAALRIEASARQALAAITEGDTLRIMLAALRRLLKVTPVNTVTLRRNIADETVSRGGYPFV
jgi:alkylation response protein AidB-like acyl-CoA dehydrogenase